MRRSGALALVIAAASIATLARADRAGAPEPAPRARSRESRRRRDRGEGGRRPGPRLRHRDRRRARPAGHVRTGRLGRDSLKLDTGLGVLYGRIVARAPCDELALVQTQPRVPGLVSLADKLGPPPAPGALVTVYGRRRARPGEGLLTLPARVSAAPLSLDAPLVPEAAGGPVLDAEGGWSGSARPRAGRSPWDAVKRRHRRAEPGVAPRVRRLAGPVRLRRPGCTGSPAKPTPASASMTRA